MAKTAKPRKDPIELGDSGVQILNGIITGDEYRHELRGRQLMRVIEEMRRGDATIHAGLMAVKQPIIAADYYAEAGGDDEVDRQAKDLLQYNFTEVINWKATLMEMLTMLEFGFYVGELVFGWRQVNGVDRVVLEKIAYRKQTTIEKWRAMIRTCGSREGVPSRKMICKEPEF